jgi:MFS family permease
LLVAIGMCGVLFLTSANSRLQLTAPDELRGRIMSIYIFVFAGSTPLGSAAVGWLAEHGGVRAALLQVAGLCLAGVVVAVAYMFLRVRGQPSGLSRETTSDPANRAGEKVLTEAA